MVKNSVQRKKDLGKNAKATICKLLYAVRNRFKGLDLINRVTDELWTEVHDIVQETGVKTIPMEKECKKKKKIQMLGIYKNKITIFLCQEYCMDP